MAEREGTETKSLLWELDLDFLELHRNLLTIIVSSVFPLVPTGRACPAKIHTYTAGEGCTKLPS